MISKYGEGNYLLIVRAFACRRTNRGDNAVGSAVWRLARTTDGNRKLRMFIFDFLLLLFLGFIFAHIEFLNKITLQSVRMLLHAR